MRIAVNTRLLIEGKMDGMGWFTAETLRRIVEWHPEHEFYFFFDRKPSQQFLFADNVHPVVLCPQARHPLLWYAYFEWSTRWAIRHYAIDLYLSTDGYIPLHAGVPVLDVIHDLNFAHNPGTLRRSHQWYLEHFFPRFAQRATRLATVSEYSRHDIAETYGVAEDKIGVVYNGAHEGYRPLTDAEQEKVRQETTQGRPYFIFVSTIHRRKNLQGLLRAFDSFKENDTQGVQLVVVGSRQYWAGEPADAYAAMQHKEDVVFLGHVAPEHLARLMASSVALAYPSLFEGFGIPIVEAWNAETAVITSNTTSMPEVAGEAALIIDPHDDAQIATALQRLATDNTLRQQLIDYGRRRRELFSWDRTATLLWLEIEKVVNNI